MSDRDSLLVESFPSRVGRGRVVHLAYARPDVRMGMRSTVCGFFGHDGWITRCDLEPVTCKACLRKKP